MGGLQLLAEKALKHGGRERGRNTLMTCRCFHWPTPMEARQQETQSDAVYFGELLEPRVRKRREGRPGGRAGK